MLLRWLLACLVGEALGIAVVATIYAGIDRELLFLAALWILSAGTWEGFCLGGAQVVVLRSIGVRPLPWIILTMAGAVAGYALSLAGGAGGQASSTIEPTVGLIVLFGAGLGAAMGILMGAVQWIAGRDRIAFWPWIAANATRWAGAMAVIMVAATSVERVWPLYRIAVTGAVAGAAAGFCIGAATGAIIARATARVSSG
jgi:hypothetical protein